MSRPKTFSGFAVILGAGASAGAVVGSHAPPLDSNFLSVARQRLFRKGPGDHDTAAWNTFRRKLRTAGLAATAVQRWRLEQLSTYLEARSNMPSLQAKAGRPADYSQALAAL